MILELKVTLKDVGVPVWRKLRVDSRATFNELHEILQLAFDWTNSHLHSFFVRKMDGVKTDNIEIKSGDYEMEFGMPSFFDEYNENEEVLANWFKKTNDKIMYTYDFGDDWQHEIVLMKMFAAEKGVEYPRCVGARNIAPEEDSRGEVIMGTVDLTHANSKQLVKEVNVDLQALAGMQTKAIGETIDHEVDYWGDVLQKAKEFQKLKPWEYMDDSSIFAVIDPMTEQRLFCSILGGAGENYGMAVYIVKEGYATLKDIISGKIPDNFEILLKQRSLLVSFEDREDLEKDDYELIKSYSIPFRGRKAWPEFRSFMPGFLPWFVENPDEVRLLKIALEQAMDVCNEIANGLRIPDMYEGYEIYAKVPYKVHDEILFENEVLSLEDYGVEQMQVPLSLSEFDLKRIGRIKDVIPSTVEFSLQYVEMPVQNNPNDRPAFPLLSVGADHNQGIIFYQNMLTGESEPGAKQTELLNLLTAIEGIPELILMDGKTAATVRPLIDYLDLNVEVKEHLPVVIEMLAGLRDWMV
ncbi:plasmid pRiA4b ORF-3 family protein [Virgibacillus oceani]|uniref:Uncharacterized protein n=1 Tax=Virgibacillus oceani TaxID=1479511 RepID=A0A917H4Y4_9BACI|nr:plasmid pRiA4b ORF-3 family protein [Virgibacillus oceani]GGG67785.1 hypothetical protein GCM10011398_09470 [Virgibacillus oceani]